MKTYLFYDLETSGLNPAFDQVIQFAAIRTDMNLKELERYEYLVKPNPDILPSPKAMITHRTAISDWIKGESEFTAIKAIHGLMNRPGTISLGYNTLGFDDEFLRFNFYRNLLNPYQHQYANNCHRADIYPITALFYLFHPNHLKWPLLNNKVSLKLEALNAENHLSRGMAHNAIVDVEATIELSKIFMQEKKTWDYAFAYFDKNKDAQRQNNLAHLFDKKYGLIVDGVFGASRNFCAPILHLGQHWHYKNQECWLRLDTKTLACSKPHDFIEHTQTINKKRGEPGFILPASEKYIGKLGQEEKLNLNNNILWLKDNLATLEQIRNYYCDFTYEKYPNVAVEAALYYQGFWNDEEKNKMDQFHQAKLEHKSQIINEMKNPVLHLLAIQSLARLDMNLLSYEQIQKLKEDQAQDKIDYKNKKKLSLEEALKEIHELKEDKSLDIEQQNLLMDLEQWLKLKND